MPIDPPRRSSPPPEPSDSQWGKAGLALLIPSLMAAGPAAGLLIGWLIRRWTGWGSWVTIVFLFLGLVAGVREVIQVIRRL